MKKSNMQVIRLALLRYLRTIGAGSQFDGIDIIDYAKGKLRGKKVYDDTVLRQLRRLRASGKINYYTIGEPSRSRYYLDKISDE